jgi:hypothetical protein
MDASFYHISSMSIQKLVSSRRSLHNCSDVDPGTGEVKSLSRKMLGLGSVRRESRKGYRTTNVGRMHKSPSI